MSEFYFSKTSHCYLMKTRKVSQTNKNNADIYAKDDDGITCYE